MKARHGAGSPPDCVMHDEDFNPEFDAVAGRGGPRPDGIGRGNGSSGYGRRQPSLAVIEAVTSATQRDALDLEPLYSEIDPDALDMLLASANGDVCVGFQYEGCNVTVDGNGDVTVDAVREE